MVRDGLVRKDERVVLFNTGAGLKYVDLIRPELPEFKPAEPPVALSA
jgi:hypothetical protein